jgi:ADP-ribosylation factor related protein 1
LTTCNRKEEFSVIIVGLDGAGKTVRSSLQHTKISRLENFQTLLEKIKTLYNDVPGLAPENIAPTVGQNSKIFLPSCTMCFSYELKAGKITLPSTILQFWDLGGQKGIRSIWHRYYDDCHAVVYVIDAQDRERLSEGWEVFGAHHNRTCPRRTYDALQEF